MNAAQIAVAISHCDLIALADECARRVAAAALPMPRLRARLAAWEVELALEPLLGIIDSKCAQPGKVRLALDGYLQQVAKMPPRLQGQAKERAFASFQESRTAFIAAAQVKPELS